MVLAGMGGGWIMHPMRQKGLRATIGELPMTIRGDLEALGVPADTLLDWLESADVFVYLFNEVGDEDVTAFQRCIYSLRKKCGRRS
jgi:hypothetical protein